MVTISDELLQQAGLTDDQARVEIACRLFENGLIPMPAATRFAQLSRTSLESELMKRGIPLVRYTAEMVEEDLRGIESMRGGQ